MILRTPVSRRRGLVLAVAAVMGLSAVTGPVAAEPRSDRSDQAAASATTTYRVIGPRTAADRSAVARTGAAIDYSEHGVLHISATPAEMCSTPCSL